MNSGIEELRQRVEKLLGEKPVAPMDVSQLNRVEEETRQLQERRERVAGGELLGAAFRLVGELVARQDRSVPDPVIVNRLRDGLNEHVERDETGRPQLRLTLPDDQSLGQFATLLAQLLIPTSSKT